MKCDELKAGYIDDFYCEFYDSGFPMAYLKDEVDDVLAEKNTEIRRLRRALWLTRAERAKERKFHFDTLDYLGISAVTINFESARTWMTCKTEEPSKWAIIFEKVEQKCRAKAEQYK